jgi:outer membrane immunogenic protein
MRIRLLLATAIVIGTVQLACAADQPVKRMVTKAPPAPATAALTWNCYLGANGGYAWTHKDWVFEDGVPQGSHRPEGGVVGGQIGCDWQVQPTWMVGFRVMYDWTDLKGSNIEAEFTGHTINTQVRGFGTAVVRAGWLVNPNLQFYVLGGLAWIHDKHWEANRTTGALEAFSDVTRFGYDVGAGAEFLFNPNWSVFVEYDYINVGTRRIDFTCPPCTSGIEQYDIKQDMQKILVGLNWRWTRAGWNR